MESKLNPLTGEAVVDRVDGGILELSLEQLGLVAGGLSGSGEELPKES
jgi:hypothetical protein